MPVSRVGRVFCGVYNSRAHSKMRDDCPWNGLALMRDGDGRLQQCLRLPRVAGSDTMAAITGEFSQQSSKDTK